MRTIAKSAISTFSIEMQEVSVLAAPASAAWPAANDALFMPLVLFRPALVKRLFVANGATAGNNVDMGIYSADGSKIVSIGSTAQAGTSVLQFFDIADTYLSPGQYYLALAFDGTTATIKRISLAVIRLKQMGVMKMASAFALPAAATFATVTSSVFPLCGLDLGGTL